MQNKAGYFIIMVLLIMAGLVQASQLESLFLETNNARMNNATTIDVTDASRYRMAPIKPGFLQKADGSPALEIGDQFLLNLFTDATDTVFIDKIFNYLPGTYTVRARVPGKEFTLLFLTFTGEKLIGLYSIPEESREYHIISDAANGMCCIKQMRLDARDVLEDAPALISPDEENLQFENEARSTQNDDSSLNDQLDGDGNTIIDVMILYTPAAKTWAEKKENSIRNTISSTMSLSQTVLDNSNIYITLNLVFAQEVNYTESGSSNTDLKRLTFHAGYDPDNQEKEPRYLEEVHDWRNQYNADLTALLTNIEDIGGVSWQLKYTGGHPNKAFCISRVAQTSFSYTLIHEWGHNMGAGHHKQQPVQPGPGMFHYSAGWNWSGLGGENYNTVMSYGVNYKHGIDVGRFSNPFVTYQGLATGDTLNGDNARTLNFTRSIVSKYRSIKPSTNPQLSGYVYTTDNIGLDNVTLVFSNGGGTAITDINGYYSKTVPYNWSGKVTPQKTDCLFSPSFRTYTDLTRSKVLEDYIAYQQTDDFKVLSPNGGEAWARGEKHIITWFSNTADEWVNIDLYSKGEFIYRLKEGGASNNGKFTWDIGDDIPYGTKYKIRIRGKETQSLDESDQNFTIQELTAPEPPVLQLPANGEINVSTMPRLDWIGNADAIYRLQISSDNSFKKLLLEDKTILTAHYNVPAWILSNNNTFYWRVLTDLYGISSKWSQIYQFQTTGTIDSVKLFISNLSPAKYQAVYLDENEKYYTDRNYQVTWIPEQLKQLFWIRSANDDKNKTTLDYIRFQLHTNATIYIAYDNRAVTPPDWMADQFKLTDFKIEVNDKFENFNIWKKHASPGQISLGGNMAHGADGANTNYIVLIKPDETPTAITLLSPNGGETWYKGSTQSISWSNIGTINNVKIELYKAGSLTGVIQESTTNDDSLAWTLPDTLIAGDDYTVRITAVERDTVWDVSDAPFNIADVPKLSILSPNGDETWQKGSTQTITWNSIGNIGDEVKIDLYKNGSLSGVIQESTANDDSLAWTLPDSLTSGEDYKIKITSVAYDTVWDESESPFIITDIPQITVLTPNGSESWQKGSTQTITWNSIGNVGNEVKIDLYKDGSLTGVIQESTANDDSLAWTLPDSLTSGEDYKIKITSVANDTVWDESDSPFIITDIPLIAVLTPNGGETWQKGSTQTITWNSIGNVGDEVKIDLYKNGSLSTVIQESTANDDSLEWTVPLNLASGNDYTIKITALANSDRFDSSDNNFTIQNPVPALVNLLTPVNQAIITSQTPLFSWSESDYAALYRLQVGADTLFTAPSLDVETDSSHYTPGENLAAGSYYWRVLARNESGESDWSSIFAFRIESSGILDYNSQEIPDHFYLAQNYPNPFNPVTTIKCGMPKAGHVEVRVINLSGQLIGVLLSRNLQPGTATLTWNAAHYPSGVYYYIMTANGFREVKKMLLVK